MIRIGRGFILAALLVLGSASVASGQIQGTLSNFDATNNTGGTANDFEVVLDGIQPDQIGGLYVGDYPNVSVSPQAGGTRVRWTGSSTPAGGVSHFGFTIDGAANPNNVAMSWTLDGGITGTIPDAAQFWQMLAGNINMDDITNRSTQPLWIQRRTTFAAGALILDDLLVGGTIWNQATLLDPSPIPLGVGQTVLTPYPPQALPLWTDVMIYTVYADAGGAPGLPLITYLNGAVVPEPSAMLLVLTGALLGLRRR